MRGDDEPQTAHTPIALMLCSKLENLATMPRRAGGPKMLCITSSFGMAMHSC